MKEKLRQMNKDQAACRFGCCIFSKDHSAHWFALLQKSAAHIVQPPVPVRFQSQQSRQEIMLSTFDACSLPKTSEMDASELRTGKQRTFWE